MADPKITPTVDEKSCCSSGCCGNKCCSKGNLRASIGRIAVGVILLWSMFVFGMKAWMMWDRWGRDKKWGCMMWGKWGCGMDKMWGCGMMNDNYMKSKWSDVTPPAPTPEAIPAEVVPAPESDPTPAAEEATGTIVQ
jgi:hypothetical protein